MSKTLHQETAFYLNTYIVSEAAPANGSEAMEFPALHYQANGKDFYLGLIPADRLIQNYDIDAHSQDNLKGYQRHSKLIRSKRFANFVSKFGGFFHQTVLANVRDPGSIR